MFIFLLGISSNTLAYSPYSTSELEELEKQFVQLINQSDSIERNPLAIEYINHLGRELAYYAHIPTPYFFIVKSNEINAFAGPGGYIGVNSQLILLTDNESELAAVMAHEIAHVRLHHLYNMIEHQKQMRVPMLASLLASIALGVINPSLGSGAIMASMTGFAQDNINFTRSNEKEADRIGIGMLIKSGLNPHAMANFFRKMQQNSRYYYTANIPAILRTHPLDDDRVAEAENRSSSLAKTGYPNNLNYQLFKELIRVSVSQNSKQLIDYYKIKCTRSNDSCQYGYALALIQMNQLEEAQTRLSHLLETTPDNLFYQITMAQAELSRQQYELAITRLSNLQKDYPENYAVVMAYGQALFISGKSSLATKVLLKGSRLFKKDLPLCEALARAQAADHQIGYAYFTKSQCLLLQGRGREAIQQLRRAEHLAKKDYYLKERVTAMIDEIKFQLEK